MQFSNIVIMSWFLWFSGFISQTVKLGTQTTSTCRHFSIEELKEATKNFDLSTYIGQGSIGKVPFNHSKCCLKLWIFFFFFLILREDILLRWVLLFYQVILRKQNWIDFSFQILIVSKLFFRMKGFFLSLLNTKLTENKYIECRIRKLAVNLKMPKVLEFLECCNFWNPCQDFTNHMHIKKVIVLGPLLFFYG